MLLSQTLRYLPAQLIGPLAQFGALIAWTHLLPPTSYGLVALVFAMQDLAYLTCLSWWSQYILRYLPVVARDGAGIDAEAVVLLVCSGLQMPIAVLSLVWTGTELNAPILLATGAFTLSRSLTTYLGERARTTGHIFVYTVAQTVGPVAGLGLGLLLIRLWSGAVPILAGFAIAQIAALPWIAKRLGLRWRLGGWLAVLRPALRYGFPLLAAGGFGWLSLNGIRFVVEAHGGLGDVGLFSVGWNLAQRLMAVVAMLVTAAAFPLAVRMLATEGRQKSLAQISSNGALFIGILLPATVGLIAVGPTLTHTMVGLEFRDATLIVLPLATLAAAVRNLRVHFPDQVFLIVERPDMALAINACEGFSTILLCAVGLDLGGLPGACLGCVVAQIVCAFLSFGIVMIRYKLPMPLEMIFRFVLGAMVMAVCLHLVRVPPSLPGLAIQVAVGGLAYAATLVLLFRSALPAMFGHRA